MTRSVELVKAAQGGDQAALNRLLGRYYERLRLIIRFRMSTQLKSCLESGDIVQDTIITAFLAFDKFEVRNEASFLHWLRKIAENKILEAVAHSRMKKRDVRRNVMLDDARTALSSGEIRLEPASPGPQPDELAAHGDELDFVISCAQELPEHYLDVFLLRLYSPGRGEWAEITEALGGESVAATRMLFQRAVARLTRIMARRRSEGA